MPARRCADHGSARRDRYPCGRPAATLPAATRPGSSPSHGLVCAVGCHTSNGREHRERGEHPARRRRVATVGGVHHDSSEPGTERPVDQLHGVDRRGRAGTFTGVVDTAHRPCLKVGPGHAPSRIPVMSNATTHTAITPMDASSNWLTAANARPVAITSGATATMFAIAFGFVHGLAPAISLSVQPMASATPRNPAATGNQLGRAADRTTARTCRRWWRPSTSRASDRSTSTAPAEMPWASNTAAEVVGPRR